jgi:hypothetical protein
VNLGTSQEETTTQQGSKLLFHIPNSNNVWYVCIYGKPSCKPEPKQQDDSNRKKRKTSFLIHIMIGRRSRKN